MAKVGIRARQAAEKAEKDRRESEASMRIVIRVGFSLIALVIFSWGTSPYYSDGINHELDWMPYILIVPVATMGKMVWDEVKMFLIKEK